MSRTTNPPSSVRMAIRSITLAASILAISGEALAQNGEGVTLRSRDLDNQVQGTGRYAVGNVPNTGTPGTVAGGQSGVMRSAANAVSQTTSSSWWFRLPGDTREYALSEPTGRLYFNALPEEILYQFYPIRTGSNILTSSTFRMTENPNNTNFGWRVSETLSISNGGNQPVTLSFFNYLDPSVNGTQAGDQATLVNGDPTNGALRMDIADGPWTLQYKSFDATSYIAGARANDGFGLTDDNATNWANTGFPLAAGDIACGFQYNLTIPAGGEVSIFNTITLVPSPGAGALLGLGSLLCARRRRACAPPPV